jgi:hypothetical protein
MAKKRKKRALHLSIHTKGIDVEIKIDDFKRRLEFDYVIQQIARQFSEQTSEPIVN